MTQPDSTFTAYIDESGCSGDKFGNGSSDFLAIGATIIRDELLPGAMSIFDAARESAGSSTKYKKFSKENGKNRYLLTQKLGTAKLATCLVAIHKPSMQGTHIRDNHANEYNYLLKMLIERISWAVRDARELSGRKNGPCHLVLSEQRMYPYDEMFNYFAKLRKGAHNCRAEWKWISGEQPEIIRHEDETPVHLADIVASAFAMAIEPKDHGMTDDRFLRNFAGTIYQKHDKLFGLKLFPDREMRQRTEALQRLL
jgi:hypothetical protein